MPNLRRQWKELTPQQQAKYGSFAKFKEEKAGSNSNNNNNNQQSQNDRPNRSRMAGDAMNSASASSNSSSSGASRSNQSSSGSGSNGSRMAGDAMEEDKEPERDPRYQQGRGSDSHRGYIPEEQQNHSGYAHGNTNQHTRRVRAQKEAIAELENKASRTPQEEKQLQNMKAALEKMMSPTYQQERNEQRANEQRTLNADELPGGYSINPNGNSRYLDANGKPVDHVPSGYYSAFMHRERTGYLPGEQPRGNSSTPSPTPTPSAPAPTPTAPVPPGSVPVSAHQIDTAFQGPNVNVPNPGYGAPGNNSNPTPAPTPSPGGNGQYPPGYGDRIDAPPGTFFTADFRDSDGDGIDDRTQPGPGMPPPGESKPGHSGPKPPGPNTPGYAEPTNSIPTQYPRQPSPQNQVTGVNSNLMHVGGFDSDRFYDMRTDVGAAYDQGAGEGLYGDGSEAARVAAMNEFYGTNNKDLGDFTREQFGYWHTQHHADTYESIGMGGNYYNKPMEGNQPIIDPIGGTNPPQPVTPAPSPAPTTPSPTPTPPTNIDNSDNSVDNSDNSVDNSVNDSNNDNSDNSVIDNSDNSNTDNSDNSVDNSVEDSHNDNSDNSTHINDSHNDTNTGIEDSTIDNGSVGIGGNGNAGVGGNNDVSDMFNRETDINFSVGGNNTNFGIQGSDLSVNFNWNDMFNATGGGSGAPAGGGSNWNMGEAIMNNNLNAMSTLALNDNRAARDTGQFMNTYMQGLMASGLYNSPTPTNN